MSHNFAHISFCILQASFNITLTADKLTNDIDWTVRIPGFGQFVVELTGVSDCNCNSNPV